MNVSPILNGQHDTLALNRGASEHKTDPSAVYAAQSSISEIASLAQYLCQPLLNHLIISSRGFKSQARGSLFTATVVGSSPVVSPEDKKALHDGQKGLDIKWLDEVWESYLSALRQEIDLVLEQKKKVKHTANGDADNDHHRTVHKETDSLVSSGKCAQQPFPGPSISSPPEEDGRKASVGNTRRSLNSSLATKVAPAQQQQQQSAKLSRKLSTTLPAAPSNQQEQNADYSSAPSSTPNLLSKELGKPHAKKLDNGKAYLVTVQSYFELSEEDRFRTVLSRFLGKRVQAWFSSHRFTSKIISWIAVLLCGVVIFGSEYINRVLEFSIECGVSLWFIMYLSSFTNWCITASSALRFDFVFFSFEVMMLVVSRICMQYVRYIDDTNTLAALQQQQQQLQQDQGMTAAMSVYSYNLQWSFFADSNDVSTISNTSSSSTTTSTSPRVYYDLSLFASFCVVWIAMGTLFLLSVLFYDGFSVAERSYLRYLYVMEFSILSIYLALAYFHIIRTRAFDLSPYLDFQKGLITYSSLASTGNSGIGGNTTTLSCAGADGEWTGAHRLPLFDYWLNRGITVCIVGLRICINGFLYPQDFVFIKSRMRTVYNSVS